MCEYRMRADGQSCDTCIEREPDCSRITKYNNWQPSDLCTAYLAAMEHDARDAVIQATRAILNPDDEYYLAELALEKALRVYDEA